MDCIFTKTFLLEAIHTDCFGRAKPSALLYFAQEAAGAHCIALGLDNASLADRNLFWVILRNRVQIRRLPQIGETVTVKTWPMPTTRAAFPRAFTAYDEDGRELFRCTSLWALVDADSRTMVLPGKSGVSLEGVLLGEELPAPESIPARELENTSLFHVGYSMLDRNFHMNNTRYFDWIDDLLSSDFHREHPVRSFSICYLFEVRETQEITLKWQLSDDNILQVNGYRAAENDTQAPIRVFAAKVQF